MHVNSLRNEFKPALSTKLRRRFVAQLCKKSMHSCAKQCRTIYTSGAG